MYAVAALVTLATLATLALIAKPMATLHVTMGLATCKPIIPRCAQMSSGQESCVLCPNTKNGIMPVK
jgi:hypothetical protein